jgi:hypothetical protein
MADLYPNTASNIRSRAANSAAAAFAAPASFQMNTKPQGLDAPVRRYALYNEDETNAVSRFNSFDDPSSDLLMSELDEENKNDFRISYDSIGRIASISALPKDLGKVITLSAKNGNLKTQYCTRAQDISGKMPVGNHDLIKSLDIELKTDIKQPFVIGYETVYAHCDEHFYGNSIEGNNRSVAHVFIPSDFVNGATSAKILERTITTSMRMFLKRYPGQTVDTLHEYVNDLKNTPNVLVRYSPNGGVSSAVTMWYDALVDENGRRLHAPLVPLNDGQHASMSREVYKQCEALARTEIAKYISLGDVTSENFTITIRALPANGNSELGINDFAYHHPAIDPMAQVPDPVTGQLITALELFNKTPISISLRSVATYKKVNDGTTL